MKNYFKKYRRLLILGAACTSACTGQSQPPSGEGELTYDPPAPFVRDEACSADINVTPTPLRRVTHREYDNAVRDLLNTSLQLAKSFPNDLPAAGFASNRGDPLAVLGAEKLMLAAEEHASNAIARIDNFLPCDIDQRNSACAQDFINDFGQKAYRRALTVDEAASLIALFEWGVGEQDFNFGLQVVIEHILQSPNFLYVIEQTQSQSQNQLAGQAEPLTGLSIAHRLAAMLWQSIPDSQLLNAAAEGKLDTPAGILAEAKRMLADSKGRDGIVEFFNQWLDIEKLEITEKNSDLFPNFSPELRSAMWQETTAFVDYVIRQGDGSLNTLLTSNLALPAGPLADFYQVSENDSFVAIDEFKRSGLLTHPSFLAVHAHGDQTSPVKRGVFVRDRIMCSPLPEAPANVVTTPPAINPDATTRERFSAHRENPACAACHDIIDPLGFAFEHFDATGRYRDAEGDLAIDASGELVATKDMNGFFNGVNELNAIFTESAQVRDCMATQWLRYAIRVEETSANACSLQQVKRAFDSGNIKELIFAIVQSDAFRYKNTSASQVGALQ